MSVAPSQLFRRRLPLDDDAGFSLLEVVVAFVIFVVVAGGATYGIVSALNASRTSQQRVDASDVAQQFIANAQQQAQLGANGQTISYPSVKGENFKVISTSQFLNGATKCNPGGSYVVNVEVYMMPHPTTQLARSDTVITC